jgi:hypothetical protein
MVLTIIPNVNAIMQVMPLMSVTAFLAMMLLPILIFQELTARIDQPNLKTLRQSLNLISTPLFIGFVIATGLRIYLILERYYLYKISLP